LIVNSGLTWIRDRINGDSSDITHLGIGTSTAAVAANQTALGTEVFPDTVDRNTSTDSNKDSYTRKYTMTLTTAQANGSTLTEVGAFNNATTGTMAMRQTHTAIAKTVALSIKYQVEIVFST
jgi:hypothetical protein